MIKQHDYNNLGRKWFTSSITLRSWSVTEESLSQNSRKVGTWRQELIAKAIGALLTGLPLVACSACLFILPRTTSPGIALPT